MYSGASNFVTATDTAFVVIIGISVIFLVGITAIMLWFIYRYSKKRNPVATQIHGSNTLEVVWTIIPTILVLVMFFYGWAGYSPMRNAPKDAMKIRATARMWSWMFEYENGIKTDTLYVPLDKAVALDLISVDVIHSLYIPAFRVKEDMVPGKTNKMWFIAQKEGKYELFCTEYCGLSHSYMFTEVKVLPQKEFDAWYARMSDTTLQAEAAKTPGVKGKQLVQMNGCIACHSVDGSKLIGPSFKGIYGQTHSVITNDKEREVVVDDEYIKRAIYEPNDDVVKGYTKGMMISYKEQLSEAEIAEIIEYLKTLK
ncbi:MAG: cytochrome c oxidase subunit II [Bacteroidetes bacterium HGW-Bacteroidetes-11]|jgi:cytochrome c oxidase subunit 2|nr:MAG: cytochrome c oxidase subunit II [Bacteroidetes bacterium HGW-Bacteroidetes-11]